MYELFSAISILLILFLVLLYCRKRQIIFRITRMSTAEKCNFLNQLAEPFGFCYDAEQDVFSTRTDAWQKTFGYGTLYDLAAPSMNMILDTVPVYFNYGKKTWLIQFWKGQYGITAGAEVGIYHADSLIPPALRSQTLFQAADKEEMLPLSIRLFSRGRELFCFERIHWWLTGFLIGAWFPPSDLRAEYTITFPDREMCESFLRGLTSMGYSSDDLKLECTSLGYTPKKSEPQGPTLRFTFSKTKPADTPAAPGWRQRYILGKNRIFCWIYQQLTSPFYCTADQLLYLYYRLPFAFRRTICPRTFKKHLSKKIPKNKRLLQNRPSASSRRSPR